MPLPEALKATQFTSETARTAAKRSAEVRRQKREAEQQEAAHLQRLAQALPRELLGPLALTTATQLIASVQAGKIPVRNASEAAALLRVLVDIGRLEAGEATSHSLSANVSVDEVRAALAERLKPQVNEAQPGMSPPPHPLPGGKSTPPPRFTE